jgi:hypothetical protein
MKALIGDGVADDADALEALLNGEICDLTRCHGMTYVEGETGETLIEGASFRISRDFAFDRDGDEPKVTFRGCSFNFENGNEKFMECLGVVVVAPIH